MPHPLASRTKPSQEICNRREKVSLVRAEGFSLRRTAEQMKTRYDIQMSHETVYQDDLVNRKASQNRAMESSLTHMGQQFDRLESQNERIEGELRELRAIKEPTDQQLTQMVKREELLLKNWKSQRDLMGSDAPKRLQQHIIIDDRRRWTPAIVSILAECLGEQPEAMQRKVGQRIQLAIEEAEFADAHTIK